MKYYIQFWKRSFDFKGVASRPQYWFAVLFNMIVVFVLGIIIGIMETIFYNAGNIDAGFAMESVLNVVITIYAIAMIVPSISITVRRLHDRNMSGWLYLIGLLPVVGGLALFIFTVLGTVRENNRWRMFDIQRGYIKEDIFTEPLSDTGKWVYKDYEYEEK